MRKMLLLISVYLFTLTPLLYAEEHEVEAVGVKFVPLFIFVQPGDTVTWTNMPAHLVESIDSMMPEGAVKMLSPMGENYTYTVTEQSGVHMYKCTPHWGARMGGGIVVGNPENMAEIFDQYKEAIEADGSLKPAKGLLKKLKKEMEKRKMI